MTKGEKRERGRECLCSGGTGAAGEMEVTTSTLDAPVSLPEVVRYRLPGSAERPTYKEIMKRQTLSEVSSVMNCEALAFVAAQLHAAKCVQRYKCSEIAQALKETLCFLFVLFVISVNIRLILCCRVLKR